MATKGSTLTTYPPSSNCRWSKTTSVGIVGKPSIVKKYGVKADNQVVTWTRKYCENSKL